MRNLNDEEKRSFLADILSQGIGIFLTADTSEERVSYAQKGLPLLLDHVMQFLRGEETSYEAVEQGRYWIEKAIETDKKAALFILADQLKQKCAISQGHAAFLLLPAFYELTAEHQTQDASVGKERIDHLGSIIFPGTKSKKDIKMQLEFIGRILGLNVPEFIGEEALETLTKSIHMDSLSNSFALLSSEDIYNLYLSAFKMYRTPHGTLVKDETYKEIEERQNFVKGLQELTLETLLLTQKFLDEQHLTFFLGEGTMLGAVRHHGFIPWDDDVDILMPRDDYERLVGLAKEGKVPAELNFDALENNDKHWVLGAKMQLVRETDYIQEKVIPLSKCHGPYVDIFPLDYWPKENSLRQRWADLNVKICRRMLFLKTGYSKATNKNMIRIVLKFITLFVTNRQIENYAMWNMKKFFHKERNYMVNLCSYYPFYKQVFPVKCYQEKTIVSFEGHDMPIPKAYDTILKKIYGKKYDSIPPYTVTEFRRHAFSLKSKSQENI